MGARRRRRGDHRGRGARPACWCRGDHVRLLDPSTAAAAAVRADRRRRPAGPARRRAARHPHRPPGRPGRVRRARGDRHRRPTGRRRSEPPAGLRYLRVAAGGPRRCTPSPARSAAAAAGLAGIAAAMLRLDPATGARSSWRARAGWPPRVPRSYGWALRRRGRRRPHAGRPAAVLRARQQRPVGVGDRVVRPGLRQAARDGRAAAAAARRRRRWRWSAAARRSSPAGSPTRAAGRSPASTRAPCGRARWPGAPRSCRRAASQAAIDQLAAAGGRVYLYGTFATVGGKARPSRLAAISARWARPAVRAAPRQERGRRAPGRLPGVRGRDRQPGGEAASRTSTSCSTRRAAARCAGPTHPTLAGPVYAGPAGLVADTAGGAVALPRVARRLFAVLGKRRCHVAGYGRRRTPGALRGPPLRHHHHRPPQRGAAPDRDRAAARGRPALPDRRRPAGRAAGTRTCATTPTSPCT